MSSLHRGRGERVKLGKVLIYWALPGLAIGAVVLAIVKTYRARIVGTPAAPFVGGGIVRNPYFDENTD